MNKEELRNKIIKGLSKSLNESKAFDPKNNKDHKAAYNSFVKWYNRWKEKLGREEIRALVKKVANDALGDNLDMINEAYKMPNPIVNTYTGPLPKVDSDDNAIYDEETGETIATIGEYGIVKFKPGLSLQDKLNYRDAILKNRTLKSWFNIDKSSFIYHQPELYESLNESGYNIKLDDGTSIYHSDPSSQIKDLKTNGKVWIAVKGTNDKATRAFQKDNQEFLSTCKKLGLQVSGNVERKDINGNIHKLYTLNESGIHGPEDDHLAFDLFLTFQNTRELHDLSRPMVNNLIKRLRKDEELSVDVLAASSIVEKYTKATIEEYKRTVDGAPSVINTSTRKNLKRRIAQDLINDAKDDYAFELHDM